MNPCRMASIATMMAALAAAAALSACGGGGGDSPVPNPPPPPPSPVPGPAPDLPLGTAGIYAVDYGQFHGVYTLLADGTFEGVHFVDFVEGVELAGHPHGALGGTNSVSAPEAISWANFIDDADQVGAQDPNGIFGRTFTSTALDIRISGHLVGSFTTTVTAQLEYGDGSSKTLYGDPIPMSTIAGTYSGILRTVGINTPKQAVSGLSIDGAGHITGAAVNCLFAGTIVQHGATGVFDAVMNTSGGGCLLAPVLGGLATPLSFIGGKPRLAVQLDSADNLQAAVFIVTRE